jgi:hypothetical protein
MSSYADKLRDPRWQRKRLEVMQRDGWCCVECGTEDRTLTVHHDWYVGEPWDAPFAALRTLCDKCHRNFHRKADVYGWPVAWYTSRFARMLRDDVWHDDHERSSRLAIHGLCVRRIAYNRLHGELAFDNEQGRVMWDNG